MGGGTFNATSTACVLLTIPTTTLPCFTASEAYSTWKIRPCGELFIIISFTAPIQRAQGNLQCNRVVIVIVSEHLEVSAALAACECIVKGSIKRGKAA